MREIFKRRFYNHKKKKLVFSSMFFHDVLNLNLQITGQMCYVAKVHKWEELSIVIKPKIAARYYNFFKKLLLSLVIAITYSWSFAQLGTVQTSARLPVSTPFIRQYISFGNVTSIITLKIPNQEVNAYVYGKIQCVGPVPFSIMLNTNYRGNNHVLLNNGMNPPLGTTDLLNAFDNFSPDNLILSPGAPPVISGDIRLPDGIYNICFFAKYFDSLGQFSNLTDPNLGCGIFTVSCSPIHGAFINTTVTSQANPIIEQTILGGGVNSGIQFNAPKACGGSLVKLFGKIECTSPLFTITPSFGYIPAQTLFLTPGSLNQISILQQRDALGNFDVTKLVANGIDLASITDLNGKISLPDGTYHICYYARYFDSTGMAFGNDASNPNTGCGTFTINCAPINGVQMNTIVKPQLNPVISQAILSSGVSTSLQINNQPTCNTRVKLFGKIERISPSPFSVSLNPDYQQQPSIALMPGNILQLTPTQQAYAFGNFNESNLVATGIDLASIKDANNNIKLPDGNYRICFYARYITPNGTLAGYASDPNLGCGTFNICYQAGGAPQFTQPVGNLNINSDFSVIQPTSPVTFTWTPPQSTCGLPAGGFTYDFEIWELFPNQNVTDAINNPFVFQKTFLPATTFLLDTNLYRNVLEQGKRYAIRVRAVSTNPNSPIEIDNNGYSRVEVFQYGGSNLITQGGTTPDPHDYYISFKERKSDMWDDVYRAFRNHLRGDTLIPIEEYIAFALAENGTAYNLDAIELFLALNPKLADVKKVKISYTPVLPVFPEVAENDLINFKKEHQLNLEPNNFENNKFLNYLDTLNNYKQKIPGNAVKLINDLVSHLNNIKVDIDSVDRISINYINVTLSELLYELRLYANGMNNSQYSQLQGLVSTLMELTPESLNSASFIYQVLLQKTSSLSSYKSIDKAANKKMSFSNYLFQVNERDSGERLSAVIVKQVLPFDVIVFRNSKDPQTKPVLDAPDLVATYRILYTLSGLYNHRNPEVNAKSTSRLASTVQVSLPSNTRFTFWTLNMLNHKMTNAEDVDLRGVLLNSMKKYPDLKKPSIVLKVD